MQARGPGQISKTWPCLVKEYTAECRGKCTGAAPEIEFSEEPPERRIRGLHSPDISRLRELGYQPRYTLDEGLTETVEWFLEHETGDSGERKECRGSAGVGVVT